MTDRFSTDQAAVIDRDNRLMSAAGYPMSQELNDLWAQIDSAGIGYTAPSANVNAIAGTGQVASRNSANPYDGTSLDFAWNTFRLHNGKALITVAAGSLTMVSSSTNYVEVDRAGTVSRNTTGFTSGRFALFTVVTGASSYSAANVTPMASPHTLIGTNGVDGSMMSTAGQTKEIPLEVGTVPTAAGSLVFTRRVPTTIGSGGAGTVNKISFVGKDALAASDTNYIKWGVVNKGAAGAGSTAIVDITAAANSTKVTGGAALAAYTPRDLVIASAAVNGGDVLEITITGVGTLANAVTEASMLLEFGFLN